MPNSDKVKMVMKEGFFRSFMETGNTRTNEDKLLRRKDIQHLTIK